MGGCENPNQKEKMTYQLIVRPLAEENATEAYWWYEEKYEGLGNEFLLSLDACLNAIIRNPQIFRIRYKNIRMGLIERFPYGIYYVIDDNQVSILAILHFSRGDEIKEGIGP